MSALPFNLADYLGLLVIDGSSDRDDNRALGNLPAIRCEFAR